MSKRPGQKNLFGPRPTVTLRPGVAVPLTAHIPLDPQLRYAEDGRDTRLVGEMAATLWANRPWYVRLFGWTKRQCSEEAWDLLGEVVLTNDDKRVERFLADGRKARGLNKPKPLTADQVEQIKAAEQKIVEDLRKNGVHADAPPAPRGQGTATEPPLPSPDGLSA